MNPSRGYLFIVSIIAAVGSGLMAGLLFAFSNFVMRALVQQSPESGVRSMQAINALIQNPLFFALFFATALASAWLACASVFHLSQSGAPLLFIGSILFLVGTFGVTIVFNVPLNNNLAGLSAETVEAVKFWPVYVEQWLRWNHVRTVTSIAAAVLLTWAIGSAPNR